MDIFPLFRSAKYINLTNRGLFTTGGHVQRIVHETWGHANVSKEDLDQGYPNDSQSKEEEKKHKAAQTAACWLAALLLHTQRDA